ncbi:hypothetical protein [Halomicrobium urmianum]|uniref:hypothetical protein n=1 Tax=Halomicrobium urmianum TaxID=1586233 RepID=UPI001CD9211F|nr:hypothetical protein [Halomicrobium urmianum]
MSQKNDPEAAVIQEAIDTIVRELGYPSSIDLQIKSESGPRETTIEAQESGQTRSYVVRFDGRDDQEPILEATSTESCRS